MHRARSGPVRHSDGAPRSLLPVAPERIRAARRWAADRDQCWPTRGVCCRSARGGSPERFHLHTEAPRPPNSLGKAFPRVSKCFSSLEALLPPPAANGHARSLPLERRATPLPFSPFLGFRARSANAGLRLQRVKLLAHCFGFRRDAAEGVQQTQVGLRFEQGVVLVLAVDVDDRRPDFRQQIERTETAAQVDPILSGAADDPSDDELVVSPVSRLLELLLDRFRHLIKHCLYGCLFFIVTNHVRSSATARD